MSEVAYLPCSECQQGVHTCTNVLCGCLADHPSDTDVVRGFKRVKRRLHPEREHQVRGGWSEPTRAPIRVQATVGKRIEERP